VTGQSETLIPSYVQTITSMLDQIQAPPHAAQASSIRSLASNYANWILGLPSDADTSVSVGKVQVLCSTDFQALASSGLCNPLIKEFRFLLCATSLYYSAVCRSGSSDEESLRNVALGNLESVIAFAGSKVIERLEKECDPCRIEKMGSPHSKELFLVLIGMCLCISYMSEKRGETPVSWLLKLPDTLLVQHANYSSCIVQRRLLQIPVRHILLEWHMRIARSSSRPLHRSQHTLVSNANFSSPSVRCATIRDAAYNRWGKVGTCSWQVPPPLSRKLTKELSQGECCFNITLSCRIPSLSS